MSRAPAGVLHHVGRLFDAGTATGAPEWHLLQRYVGDRDALAFETLVGRHGPMVWGVCRRVLADADVSDAEDAFQATFLVLVRRARSLRPDDALGPWLHGVALRVALRARSQSLRRRTRERDAVRDRPEAAPAADGLERSEVLAVIDAECRRLPARYAGPIVLCLLQGLSHEEAARQLGCRVNTLKGRLARGRKHLQSRLVRRGIAPAATVVTAALGPRVEGAALEDLVRSAVRAAQSLEPQSAAAGTTAAHILAKGVLRMMVLRRVTAAVVGLLACGLLAAGIVTQAAGGDDPGQVRADALGPVAQAQATKPDAGDTPAGAYPVTMSPERVYELPRLDVSHGALRIKAGPVTVVPLTCEPGVTGMMVIGNGTFSFKPRDGKALDGSFRSALLRFNPKDEASLVPLTEGKKVTDYGAYEMTRHLSSAVFGHCWHKGKDALIPPPGALAVVLYAQEQGDLLISDDGRKAVVHSFTQRRTLYDPK